MPRLESWPDAESANGYTDRGGRFLTSLRRSDPPNGIRGIFLRRVSRASYSGDDIRETTTRTSVSDFNSILRDNWRQRWKPTNVESWIRDKFRGTSNQSSIPCDPYICLVCILRKRKIERSFRWTLSHPSERSTESRIGCKNWYVLT